jgi:hypothetical protein
MPFTSGELALVPTLEPLLSTEVIEAPAPI